MFIRRLLSTQRTHLLCIQGENHQRYRISYTCADDTPASIEDIIRQHIALTNANVFDQFTAYYEIAVNKHISRIYGRPFNVTLRFDNKIF